MNSIPDIFLLARFISYNRFAFSPFSANELLKKSPDASFVRPMSYWLEAGYSLMKNIMGTEVIFPHADFFFYRNTGEKVNVENAEPYEKENLYSGAELQEEISLERFTFYDVSQTNCKLRLPAVTLDTEALLNLAKSLKLDITYMPLKKLFLDSYITGTTIVLPSDEARLHTPLLMKHLAEYVLALTSTQDKQTVDLEQYLTIIMLNAILKEKIPLIEEPPVLEGMSEGNLLLSLYRTSKLVCYLLENIGCDFKSTDNLSLSYQLSDREQNKPKFRGLKARTDRSL